MLRILSIVFKFAITLLFSVMLALLLALAFREIYPSANKGFVAFLPLVFSFLFCVIGTLFYSLRIRDIRLSRIRVLDLLLSYLSSKKYLLEEEEKYLDLRSKAEYFLKCDIYYKKLLLDLDISSLIVSMEKEVRKLEEEINSKLKSNLVKELGASPKLAPSDMYPLLGVDALSIHAGEDLTPIVDPAIGGELLKDIGSLRQHITLTQGFILPAVRVCDAKSLKPNQYQIIVRQNVVASSLVHIDRYFILKRHWDKSFQTPPKDAIDGWEPNLKEVGYWINKTELDNLVKENKWTQPYLTAIQAITYHLAETASLYIDQLLTKVEVRKILDQVKQEDSTLVDSIVPNLLSVSEIRKILVNLLREKASIRDIHFILEKLEDLSQDIKHADVLSEKIRILLSRQISVQHADDKTIKAISLSSEIEKKMEDSIQVIDNEVLLGLEKVFAKKLVDKISAMRDQSQKNFIVICPPVIRLPLARLLKNF